MNGTIYLTVFINLVFPHEQNDESVRDSPGQSCFSIIGSRWNAKYEEDMHARKTGTLDLEVDYG